MKMIIILLDIGFGVGLAYLFMWFFKNPSMYKALTILCTIVMAIAVSSMCFMTLDIGRQLLGKMNTLGTIEESKVEIDFTYLLICLASTSVFALLSSIRNKYRNQDETSSIKERK